MDKLRNDVIALRKQNLSIYDIASALKKEEKNLSPATIGKILRDEGFARLPKRGDNERPNTLRPAAADAADVRQLDLSPRQFRTRFGGLFLFLPCLAKVHLDTRV